MTAFPFQLDTINAVDKIGDPVVIEPGTSRLRSESVNIFYVILRAFSIRKVSVCEIKTPICALGHTKNIQAKKKIFMASCGMVNCFSIVGTIFFIIAS